MNKKLYHTHRCIREKTPRDKNVALENCLNVICNNGNNKV